MDLLSPNGEPDRPGAGGLPARSDAERGRHRRPVGRTRSALAAVLAAAAVGSTIGGLALLGREPAVRAADIGAVPTATGPTATGPTATAPPAGAASPTGSATTARARRTATPQPPPAPPTLLSIPAARVSATVVASGVRRDGELEVPESPKVVGWWVGSAPAGSPSSSTVISGHVDSATAGVGALAALRDVAIGTRIELVDTFRGRHAYRVVARRTYPKYDLPAEVFRVRAPARLVLITCGGPFDERAGQYRDNLVVYAVPVS